MRILVGIAMLLVAGCSAAQIQQDKKVAAMLMADGKTIVVTGCQDEPALAAKAETIMSLVPQLSAAEPALVVADDIAQKVCNAILHPMPVQHVVTPGMAMTTTPTTTGGGYGNAR